MGGITVRNIVSIAIAVQDFYSQSLNLDFGIWGLFFFQRELWAQAHELDI